MSRPSPPTRAVSYGAMLTAVLSLASTVSARGIWARHGAHQSIDKRDPAVVMACRLHKVVVQGGETSTTVVTLLPGDPECPAQTQGPSSSPPAAAPPPPPAASSAVPNSGAGNLINIVGGVSTGLAGTATGAAPAPPPDLPNSGNQNLEGVVGGVSSGLSQPTAGSDPTFGKADVSGNNGNVPQAEPPLPSDTAASTTDGFGSTATPPALPSVTSVAGSGSGGGDTFGVANVGGSSNRGGPSMTTPNAGGPSLGPAWTSPCTAVVPGTNQPDCGRPPLVLPGNSTYISGGVSGILDGSRSGAFVALASVTVAMLFFGL